MDIRHESDIFVDSDSEEEIDLNVGHEQAIKEDLTRIDETIKSVSRNLRKGDWTYLSRHPEVRAIIRVITMEAIRTHPKNLYSLTSHLFHCNNHKKLLRKINKQLKWINCQLQGGAWSPADGEDVFTVSSSSSFNPKKSTCETNNNINNNQNNKSSDEQFVKQSCPDNFKPSC